MNGYKIEFKLNSGAIHVGVVLATITVPYVSCAGAAACPVTEFLVKDCDGHIHSVKPSQIYKVV
jgi:hypothetical protein